jgi:hypothetical protein
LFSWFVEDVVLIRSIWHQSEYNKRSPEGIKLFIYEPIKWDSDNLVAALGFLIHSAAHAHATTSHVGKQKTTIGRDTYWAIENPTTIL